MSDQSSDWIEWSGGECPVDPDAPVHLRFRAGDDNCDEAFFGPPLAAGAWEWEHFDVGGDIIAYRVVEQSK